MEEDDELNEDLLAADVAVPPPTLDAEVLTDEVLLVVVKELETVTEQPELTSSAAPLSRLMGSSLISFVPERGCKKKHQSVCQQN